MLSLLLLCLTARTMAAPPQRPNIIWIVAEDLSPFLGCWGNKTVNTPNIDQLAKEGVRYTKVFTTSGVCAPSRSVLITGMYQTSIGTQHMRTAGDPKYQPVPPYSAVVPEQVRCFPEYLRQVGYYCTNNMKTDYQFEAPVTVWDENGPAASWKNRPAGSPFFAVFNFAITHESQLFMRSKDSLEISPDNVTVPAYYPNTETVRKDIARALTLVNILDRHVGQLIKKLKDDGLYDQTIIFFYTDHGGPLPWMKRELYDRGIHIPTIVRFPGGKDGGTGRDDLISLVDFAPTVLSLAGIQPPAHMQGQAFLGFYRVKNGRTHIFAARDRMDTEYDRVRAVRDRRFKYIRNYEPGKPSYQDIKFRLDIPMMKEMLALNHAGNLDPIQSAWFASSKPAEELYDTELDPDELRNLATNPEYAKKVTEMRAVLDAWLSRYGDLGAGNEMDMIRGWWGNANKAPKTASTEISLTRKGIRLSSTTAGASIGYIIKKRGQETPVEKDPLLSWDFSAIMNPASASQQITKSPVWKIYHDELIQLNQGDTLLVRAQRIGYGAAESVYIRP